MNARSPFPPPADTSPADTSAAGPAAGAPAAGAAETSAARGRWQTILNVVQSWFQTWQGASPRSARWLTLMLVPALVASIAMQLKIDYDTTIKSNETLVTAQTKAVEQYLDSSLNGIDDLLDDIAAALRAGQQDDDRFQERVLGRLQAFPEIRYVGITDSKGLLLPRTWPRQTVPPAGIDVSDRDYFRIHKEQAEALARGTPPRAPEAGRAVPVNRPVIGAPVYGRIHGDRTIHLSHAFYDAAGQFQGIIVAGINPDHYAAMLASSLLDPDGSCGVLTTDGQMIARAPDHEKNFARNIADSDLFTRWLPASPSGVAHLVAKIDGNWKMLGYSRLEDFPLVVTTGQSYQKALTDWKHMVVIEGGMALLVSLVVFFWAGKADRQRRHMVLHRQMLEQGVEERSEQLSQARSLADHRASRMAAMNEELQRLARITAHHLQEPLRPMVSFSLLLARRIGAPTAPEEPSPALEILEQIQYCGRQLKAMLGSFQKYVGVLTDPLQPGQASSRQLARQAVEHLLAQSPGLAARVQYSVDFLPTIHADPAMISELFLQLYGTALARRQEGEAPLHLDLTARPDGRNWLFVFSDDGKPVPPRVIELLSDGEDGTPPPPSASPPPASPRDEDESPVSMGLTVCRAIVRAHQGSFRLRGGIMPGADGKDTPCNQLIFTLPMSATARPAAESQAAAPVAGGVAAGGVAPAISAGQTGVPPAFAAMAAPSRAQLPPPPLADRDVWTARHVATLIIIILAALGTLQLRIEKDNALRIAYQLTGTVARSIEQRVGGSIRNVDALLEETSHVLDSGKLDDPVVQEHLLSRLSAFPEIRYVGTADAWGRMSSKTWPDISIPANGIDISDRDYFTLQLTGSHARKLMIGKPVLGRTNADRTLHVSRPLPSTDGKFRGIIFAALNPDAYADFIASLLLDTEGASAVIRLDGLMIARAPDHAAKFGINIGKSDLFLKWIPQATADTAHLQSKADGNRKYLSYRVLRDYPLVVTSGMSEDKALEAWWQMIRLESLLLFVVAVVIYFWAWRTDRYASSLQQQKNALERLILERTADAEQARALADSRAVNLEQTNAELKRLTSIMVHYIESPVLRVLSLTSSLPPLLASRDEDDQRAIGFVQAAAVHLNALLRDFQRYISVLTRKAQLQQVHASAIACLAAEKVCASHGLPASIVQIAPLPVIMAEGPLLYDLFQHLLTNAITYFDRPPQSLLIRISASQETPGWWRFSVQDNGPGIAPAVVGRVLRVFENAHTRDANSTGLGLPLCRVIAQAHGGSLWIDSSETPGATISFTLPGVAGTSSPFPAETAAEPPAKALAGQG